MLIADPSRRQRDLVWAIALSLSIHISILLIPRQAPSGEPAATRLEARLAPQVVAEPPPAVKPAPDNGATKAAKTPPRARLLTADKSRGPSVAPQWTAAQKAEMDNFLNELAATPKPPLAQRALAMARDEARQMAAREEAGEALLERRANSTPPDPFSLDMYLDGLLRRLNRSANYVRNDPRTAGVRTAAVQFRLNPDGSLKSFVVLNAGDQADEIAFIRSVVERSVPFSPFPPDIDKAARSLGITICIRPGGGGDGGLGFTRMKGNRCT